MRRLALALLILMALPLFALVAVLFTAAGTRSAIAWLPESVPVAIDYRRGRLLGELALDRVQLTLPALSVELRDWRSVVNPRCLWRSTLCLELLELGQVAIELRGEPEPDEASADSVGLPAVVNPLPLELRQLRLGSLRVSREGDEWLRLSGQAGVYWQGVTLALESVDLYAEGFGRARGEGELRMAEPWSVDWRGSITPATEAPLPLSLREREVSLLLDGKLSRLQVELALDSPLQVQTRLRLDALASELPFVLEARVEAVSASALQTLPEWPEDLPAPGLPEALTLHVEGDLEEQSARIEGGLALPGYPQLSLVTALRHRTGQLSLDQLSLQQGPARLELAGDLNYAEEGIAWQLQLNSEALKLPDLSQYLQGQVQGGLRTAGHWRGESWALSIRDADLAGDINGLPATLRGDLEVDSEAWIREGRLLLEANGASLALAGAEGEDSAAALALKVPELGRWQPGARGRLQLLGELSGGLGTLRLEGDAEGLAWAGNRLPSASLQAELALNREGMQTGTLLLEGPELGGLALERLSLRLEGPATAPRLALESRGVIEGELSLQARQQDAGWQFRLQSLAFDTPLGPLRTDPEVSLDWSQSRGELAAHCWYLPSLSLCSEAWTLGPEGQGRVQLDGELAVLDPLLPTRLTLEGPLEGALSASWRPDRPPVLEARLGSENGQLTHWLPEGESASWSWQRLAGTIALRDGGVAVTAQLVENGSPRVSLQATRTPGEAAELRGSLELDALELAPWEPLITPLSDLAGHLDGQLQLGGSLASPQLDGRLQWREGRLSLQGNPTALLAARSELVFQGRSARVSGEGSLGEGPLNWQGELALEPELQASLTLRGEGNRLLYPPDTEATISPDLSLGWRPGLVTLRGEVEVLEGVLAYEHLPEGGVDLSSDVVEVDYSGEVIRESQGLDRDVRLRLRIRDRFLVQGKDVEVRVGGDLSLQQSPGSPLQLFGNLKVLGGELEAYGQRLSVQPGRVAFSGLPGNPELDLRASREIRAEDLRAGVHVTGTLEQPQLEIYTDPVTSQTEALSYLVRGRGLDAGGGTDGSALALSLGTGLINRSALVSGLNRLPGVSEIEFGTQGSEESTAATVSGYLGERLYLSYGVGLYEPVNVLTARLYLQTRLWLEVVSRLENSVDLYYSFDID
ncbi:translocation/assembly module TamB domain-containing protein [Haliea atlantica]